MVKKYKVNNIFLKIVICIAFTFLFIWLASHTVNADVFFDGKNLKIRTVDIISSPLSYRTLGIDITRCATDQKQIHESRDYVSIDFNVDLLTTEEGERYDCHTYEVPIDRIIEAIEQKVREGLMSQTWADDIRAALDGGQPVYIKIDSRMYAKERVFLGTQGSEVINFISENKDQYFYISVDNGTGYGPIYYNYMPNLSARSDADIEDAKKPANVAEYIAPNTLFDAKVNRDSSGIVRGIDFTKAEMINNVFLSPMEELITGPYVNTPDVTGGEATSGKCRGGGVKIEDAYDWTVPKETIQSHYNQYILIGRKPETIPVSYEKEFVVYDHTADNYNPVDPAELGDYNDPTAIEASDTRVCPTFAMGNWSDKYDIRAGIPTTEDINVAVLADKWYACTNVWAKCVQKKYEHTIHYWWYTEPDDGSEEAKIESVDIDIPIGYATICYQYLDRPKIYNLTSIMIRNKAYISQVLQYNNDQEVVAKCTGSYNYEDITKKKIDNSNLSADFADGEQNPSVNWEPDDMKHFESMSGSGGDNPEEQNGEEVIPTNKGQFPKIKYPKDIKIENKEELNDRILKDIEEYRKLISKNIKTWNDELFIDDGEYIYMNNSKVEGCDFFDEEGRQSYKECLSSAGYVHDYLKHKDPSKERPLFNKTNPIDYNNQHIEGAIKISKIPYNAANGWYSTTIETGYSNAIIAGKPVVHQSKNWVPDGPLDPTPTRGTPVTPLDPDIPIEPEVPVEPEPNEPVSPETPEAENPNEDDSDVE